MIMLIIFPKVCMEGTKDGLILWYNSILPSLLPYMILTNVLMNTGVFENTKSDDKFFSWHTIFSIGIGFLCGYPMGAYFVSKNYIAGNIRKSAAYWLLSFVNLCSPAFIIQFIVIQNLNGKYLLPMLISIYLSAVLTGIVLLPVYIKKYKSENKTIMKNNITITKDISQCITDAFMQALKLCGYIVLFSITLKMVTAHIDTVTIRHIFLIGILEITNGIKMASEFAVSEETAVVLMALFTSFGSISCMAQTFGVCKGSDLKNFPYVIAKIIQGLFSFAIMHLILRLF